MKVKIGNKVYSSEDQPIMVILTDKDKFNIAHMAPEATRYAEFNVFDWTDEEILEWMEESDGREDA